MSYILTSSKQPTSYLIDNDLRRLETFAGFVAEVKPFRSKLKDNFTTYSFFDSCETKIDEELKFRAKLDAFWDSTDAKSRAALSHNIFKTGSMIVDIPPVVFNKCSSKTRSIYFKYSFDYTIGVDDKLTPLVFKIPGFTSGAATIADRLRVRKGTTVLVDGADYSVGGADGGVCTLTGTWVYGEKVTFDVIFSDPDDALLFSIPYNGGVAVELNGAALVPGVDYTLSGTELRLVNPVSHDDVFDIVLERVDRLHIAVNGDWQEYRVMAPPFGIPLSDESKINTNESIPDIYVRNAQIGSDICEENEALQNGYDVYGYDLFMYDMSLGDMYYIVAGDMYDVFKYDTKAFDGGAGRLGRVFIEKDILGRPSWKFELFGEGFFASTDSVSVEFALIQEDTFGNTAHAVVKEAADLAVTSGTFTFIGFDGFMASLGVDSKFDEQPFDYEYEFLPPYVTTVYTLDQTPMNLPMGFR